MPASPWRWVVRSSVAAAAATLILVPMAMLLLVVHGNLWRFGVVVAPWWLAALLLVAVSPLAAVPGCLTSYASGQSRRVRRVAALASLSGGLVGGLAITTSPLGLWLGMVVAALAAVAWGERARPHVTPRERLPGLPTDPTDHPGWTAVEVDDLEVRLDGPRSRLVPRDVLKPAEGWDVPVSLPERSEATPR